MSLFSRKDRFKNNGDYAVFIRPTDRLLAALISGDGRGSSFGGEGGARGAGAAEAPEGRGSDILERGDGGEGTTIVLFCELFPVFLLPG